MHGDMTKAGLAIGSGVALMLIANGVYVWWAILGSMVVGAFLGAGIDFNLAQTREATERLQPYCPRCHGKLPDWSVSKCLHCGTDVDLTPQVAAIEGEEAARETREKARPSWREEAAAWQRKEAAAERAGREENSILSRIFWGSFAWGLGSVVIAGVIILIVWFALR